MAQVIKFKRSETASAVPGTSDLEIGRENFREIAASFLLFESKADFTTFKTFNILT